MVVMLYEISKVEKSKVERYKTLGTMGIIRGRCASYTC